MTTRLLVNMADSIPTFKVVVVGDEGVGKVSGVSLIRAFQFAKHYQSAFVKRWSSGEFGEKYVATLGVEVWQISIDTVS